MVTRKWIQSRRSYQNDQKFTVNIIYSLSIENITQKIKDVMKLGYSQEEVIKMTKSFPSIYSLSIENMTQKIKDVMELGYSQEEVIKMTKGNPQIYGLSIENLTQKIKDVMELGYTQEEVIKMTKNFPTIYDLSIENITKKIKDVMKLGYTQEEVIKMTKNLPAIYSYSIENITEKIKFYDSINLHELAIFDTKNLMQSTILSYARYKFYSEKNINITINNYSKLFINNKNFEKTYGITKEQLLKVYGEEYLKEKKKRRVI